MKQFYSHVFLKLEKNLPVTPKALVTRWVPLRIYNDARIRRLYDTATINHQSKCQFIQQRSQTPATIKTTQGRL